MVQICLLDRTTHFNAYIHTSSFSFRRLILFSSLFFLLLSNHANKKIFWQLKNWIPWRSFTVWQMGIVQENKFEIYWPKDSSRIHRFPFKKNCNFFGGNFFFIFWLHYWKFCLELRQLRKKTKTIVLPISIKHTGTWWDTNPKTIIMLRKTLFTRSSNNVARFGRCARVFV